MKIVYLPILLACLVAVGCSGKRVANSLNHEAELPADLPANPLQWKVITEVIGPPETSRSTLYGNELAVSSAKCGADGYPSGSVLSLVTWARQEDQHGFGARTPGKVKLIEFVTIESKGEEHVSCSYEAFERNAGGKGIAAPDEAERIAFILGLKTSATPGGALRAHDE